MTPARAIVMARVAHRARRFPRLHPKPLDVGRLDARDAGLARAIDQVVARRWLTLAAVLQSRLRRPWHELDPTVQSALLVGAAQLLLLERLPDHAVINEAVTWTKGNAPKAAPLVNAVLRGIARLRDQLRPASTEAPVSYARNELPLSDRRSWHLTDPVFDDDPLRRLGQQTSHPAELLRVWVERYGADAAAWLARHDLVQPPIILAGLDTPAPGTSRPASLSPHDEPGFVVFQGDHAALEELLAEHPTARVQDPASAAAVSATASYAAGLIVDVCAGRGTKTRQLAAVHPTARIVTTDGKPAKRAALRAAFGGIDRIEVIEPDDLIRYAGQADLVVLDVPCSNTGVLARRVEAKYRFCRGTLRQLVELQRQIIADSMRLVADSGHLLYSTCSLEPEENEQQTDWIVRWHAMHPLRQAGRLPRGGPGDPPQAYADGSYFVLLRRSDRIL